MEIILRANEIPPDLLEFFEPVPEGQMTDSWLLSPESFAQAHFATFVTEIPRRAILAGCPAMCCPECGAGWRRVVERSGYPDPEHTEDDQGRFKASGEVATDTQRRKVLSGARHAAFKALNPDTTTGWERTCKHEHTEADTRPGVVLDPFVGSGTSILVALRHGRRAIGFDLNEEYCRMARDRIANDAPMLEYLEEQVREEQQKLWA